MLNNVSNREYYSELFEDYLRGKGLIDLLHRSANDNILNDKKYVIKSLQLNDSLQASDSLQVHDTLQVTDSFKKTDKLKVIDTLQVSESIQVPKCRILIYDVGQDINIDIDRDDVEVSDAQCEVDKVIDVVNSNVVVQCDVDMNNVDSNIVQCEIEHESIIIMDSVDYDSAVPVVTKDNLVNSADEISDAELISRFKKLKYSYDDCNDLNDNFLEFLDEFKCDSFLTASLSEFCNKRNSIHVSASADTCVLNKNYSDIVRNSSKTDLVRGNNKHVRLETPLFATTSKLSESIINFSPKLIDEEGFTLKESRRAYKKRLNDISEDNHNKGLEGPPPKFIDLWIYKISKGDKFTLKNFIENKNVKVFCIDKTSHEHAKFKSFKVTISMYDKIRILNSKSFFPNGIKCRQWKDHINNNNFGISSNTLTFTNKLYKDVKLNGNKFYL